MFHGSRCTFPVFERKPLLTEQCFVDFTIPWLGCGLDIGELFSRFCEGMFSMNDVFWNLEDEEMDASRSGSDASPTTLKTASLLSPQRLKRTAVFSQNESRKTPRWFSLKTSTLSPTVLTCSKSITAASTSHNNQTPPLRPFGGVSLVYEQKRRDVAQGGA